MDRLSSYLLSVIYSVDAFRLVFWSIFKLFDLYFVRPLSYLQLYGISGILVAAFGARNVWDMQAEILGSRKDDIAMAFKKSVQDESTTCAVAAAIVSQIAITALSLPFLSQTHWIAQAFWIFSLISGIMAVYYAAAQHRTMGRLLLASQVRGWIRGELDAEPDIPTYKAISDLQLELKGFRLRSASVLKPFRPCLASVLTISASQLLLSASLYSFLIGLGVYVSFIWRRKLDPNAGFNDSRNIFITYVVSIAVCEIIYTLSSSAQEEGKPEIPCVTVIQNWKNFLYAKFPREDNGLQTNRQQNPIESEKSGQFSLINPSNSAQPDDIQRFTNQRDEIVSQNQLSASAATVMRKAPTPAPESGAHEPRIAKSLQDHTEASLVSPQHLTLIKALQDSARLRRESAKLEEVIARCYEQLFENHQAIKTANQNL